MPDERTDPTAEDSAGSSEGSFPDIVQHSRRYSGTEDESVDPIATVTPPRMVVALAVGIIGICINIVWVQYVGFFLSGSALGVDYLPIGVFCLFILLIGINTLLKRFGSGLTRSEIVIAYIMMLVTAGMAHSGFAGRLVPTLAGVFEFATESNDWKNIFHRYFPAWIAPEDVEAIHLFYAGAFNESIPWSSWLVSLAAWMVPTTGMAFLMIGLALLLRKRWLEEERLTFPLVAVPLAVLSDDQKPGFNPALRRDLAFWIAFAIPVALRMLQGMSGYFPAMPGGALTVSLDMQNMFDSPAWRSLFDSTRIQIHLALIAVAVLMRKEVSASFWVFQWFYLGVGAILYAVGIGGGTLINTPQETFGYIMLIYHWRLGATLVGAAYILWAARQQIKGAVRALLHPWRTNEPDERSLPWAGWMVIGGAALYLGWTRVGGMDPTTAVLMLTLHIAGIIVLARIVADGGLFWASLSLDPMRSTVRLLGTDTMSGRTLTFVALSNQVPMAARANMLPSIMDSLQLGKRTGTTISRIVWGLAVAFGVAAFVSLVSLLWMSYSQGAVALDLNTFQAHATYPFHESAYYIRDAASANMASILTTVSGGVLMMFFIYAHRRLVWWPVYPFGFAIAESAPMECIWFSILIGWAIRVVIVRAWGRDGYARIRSGAIGLIVGDFLSIGMWTLIDMATGTIGNTMTHEISIW
jgi:hypothetical protein